MMLGAILLSAYVPWDVGLLLKGINAMLSNVTSAINVGFWVFMIITGIYFVFSFLSRLIN